MTAFGLVALGVSIAARPRAVVISPTTPETVGPDSVWPRDYVVAPGDRVVGIGQLVASGADPARLCTGMDSILGDVYHCSSLSVIVQGVDIGSLVGVRHSDGAAYVNTIVRGRWDGQTLAVDQIGGSAIGFPVAPMLACEYVVPGGVEDDQAGQVEEAYRHLQSIVDGDGSEYAGSWLSLDGSRMVVVATTKDLVGTGASLRRIFPYPMCLVRVQYPMAELSGIIDRLRLPAGISWRPELDVKRNKVMVRLAILDETAVQAVADEPAVELVPLVIKDR